MKYSPLLLIAWFLLPGYASAEDVHDFLFLAEARPVLVRLHVQVDGKALQTNWGDFVKHVHGTFDINDDGVLDTDEVSRMPSPGQLIGGIQGQQRGGRRGRPAPQPAPRDDVDADKDGKVSLAELGEHYRKSGLAPFQVQLAPPPNPLGPAAAFLGGGSQEPSVTSVSKASFALLDANRDRKLTMKELADAPDRAQKLDEDEDELVTAKEMAANESATFSLSGLGGMMGLPGGTRPAEGTTMVLPLKSPGQVPADFLRRLHERYKGSYDDKKPVELSRKDLHLDDATFAELDANKDGTLDHEELPRLVKRKPDVELLVRLGEKEEDGKRVELLNAGGRPLSRKVSTSIDLAMLDLGVTRLALRGVEEAQAGSNPFATVIRQQTLTQLKLADTNGDGVIDEAEGRNNRRFGSLFKRIDLDGDGKIPEKELIAYLDQQEDLQARATGACVTLTFTDQSRGMFTLFDANSDGRLSVRELRQGAKLLAQFDRDKKDHLAADDIPRQYYLALRSGPSNQGVTPNAILALYSSAYTSSYDTPASVGPTWFAKMDRNRDGDVSRREFLFSAEAFRRVDADGDGLISPDEAEKAEK